MKRCIQCERPAAFSVCTVISTLGIPRRRQTCTPALTFCSSWLQRVCAKGEGNRAPQICEALQTALRALTEKRLSTTEPETRLDQKNNGIEIERLL